jgi:hypothetical protein
MLGSRRSQSGRPVALLGIALGLLVVGALGTSPTAGAAAKTTVDLAAAYKTTVGAGSVKEAFSETVTSQGKTITVKGSGVADQSGNGTFDFTSGGTSLREVVENGVLYMRLPAASLSRLHVSTPWVSLNLNGLLQSKLGASYQQLVSNSQRGPAQSLAFLQGASNTGVHLVGTTTLFGTKTTEYQATIDLTKAAAVKPQLASVFQRTRQQLHTNTFTTQVWLDGTGRIRQMTEHVRIPSSASRPAGTVVVTIGIQAFSVPVAVVAPPANQVTDITAQATGSASA